MNTITRRTLPLAIASALALVLAGCGGESAPASKSSSASSAATPSAAPAFLLDAEPEGAVGIAVAKMSARAGDEVAVRGKIGGRIEPISSESAVFIMMDLAEKSCDQLHGDRCPTPWDYCCTPKDRITKLSCTVQLVDAEGKPLAIDLAESGLKPLDEVIVVGAVGPRPNEEVLVIRATGLHRVGS